MPCLRYALRPANFPALRPRRIAPFIADMNRLQSEFRRLFLPPAAAPECEDLTDAHGETRTLVLDVASIAGWQAVDTLWREAQTGLGLPAPAVAINGRDGFQLWFSLEAPVEVPRANAFLQGLQRRFLAGLAPEQVRPMPVSTGAGTVVHAPPVPGEQARPGQWSAFVKPELLALFVDTPWLDIDPGIDGQADLLRGLRSIDPDGFEAALRQLGVPGAQTSRPAAAERAPHAPGEAPPFGPEAAHARPASRPPETRDGQGSTPEDPESFLLGVMRDASVPLALRIEAARVLLAHGRGAAPVLDQSRPASPSR